MLHTRRFLAVPLALGLLIAACGDDDDDGDGDAATTTEAPETTEEDTTTTSADDGAEATAALVEVAETDLGEILVSDGMTLYVFSPDNAGPSTCYDDCATNWPPLVAEGETSVGEQLDGSLFATATRDDGGEQVTVNGWPLYFFANDSAPGDTNGQGVGDNWWVVSPAGEPIEG